MFCVTKDFCAGGDEKSPDVSVVQILNASGFEEDEITYEALQLYARVSTQISFCACCISLDTFCSRRLLDYPLFAAM